MTAKLLTVFAFFSVFFVTLPAVGMPFEKGENSLPKGWTLYGKIGPGSIRCEDGGAVRITDSSGSDETGLSRIFPLEAGGGKYEIAIDAEPLPGSTLEGALIQLRALPSGKFAFKPLVKGTTTVGMDIPAGSDRAQVFIWTYAAQTPDFRIKNFKFDKVEHFSSAPAAPVAAAMPGKPGELRNGDFTTVGPGGFPTGWSAYGTVKPSARVENGLLLITDPDDKAEAGISQDVAVTEPGKYEAVVEAKLQRADADAEGAFLQIRILPQDKYAQVPLEAASDQSFSTARVGIEVPEGTKTIRLYVYTRKQGSPAVAVKKVELKKVNEFTPAVARDGMTPVIGKLKNLSLATRLDGIVIAAGSTPAAADGARQVAAAIEAITGTKVPVVAGGKVPLPLKSNVIAIGSRDNNELLDRLYRQGFVYTDSTYPGAGGFELRSLHNPTGGNFNVIIAGGSDDPGVNDAVKALLKELAAKPKELGHLVKLRVPAYTGEVDGYNPDSYNSRMLSGMTFGYGWNYVATQMALFYQTGDTKYAKEFLRLAFPDAAAIKDFQKFNPESIENPATPLSSPYHYMGHQMILLWDLIEEHPVFSDEDRLKVTQALARQLDHEGIGKMVYGRSGTAVVPSRHGQWAAISLYVLARYFDRDYPDATWKRALKSATGAMAYLQRPDGWIEGERGIVGWFLSGAVNPGANYLALTGERNFNPEGAWANALRFFETQWNGTGSSEILGTASRLTFYLAAEQTGDGKYLYYADLLPPAKPGFRIGPSFAPGGRIAKRPPVELAGKWTAAPMSPAEHKMFNLANPIENCFLGIGYRDKLGAGGDWISVNCFNEEYRTPYKLLSISGLRINGRNILAGLGNYLQPYLAGGTEAHIPTMGEIDDFGVTGRSVWFAGGVPDHAYCDWQRKLLLRKGEFAVIADTVTPRSDSGELTAVLNFQTAAPVTAAAEPGKLAVAGSNELRLRDCKLAAVPECRITSGDRNTLFETVKAGDRAQIGFDLANAFAGELKITLMQHNSRAAEVNLKLDGKLLKAKVPHYSEAGDLQPEVVSLGKVELAKGEHQLEIEVAAVNPQIKTAWLGAQSISLVPAAAEQTALTTANGESGIIDGQSAYTKVKFAGVKNRSESIFTLIKSETGAAPAQVVRLDAGSAKIIAPEPAIAFTGESRFGRAELALLEANHLFALNATRIDGVFQSDGKVTVDWDLVSGEATVQSAAAGAIRLEGGKSEKLNPGDNIFSLKLPDAALAKYRKALDAVVPAAAGAKAAALMLPDWKAVKFVEFAEPVSVLTPLAGGDFLAASGARLFRLGPDGKVLKSFDADARIQSAIEWPKEKLILAGCADDKVIAFNADGSRRWVFTSVLAPEVKATQKYYWFKPAYPGVYSLAVAATRDGEALFAGSACTTEKIAADGNLIRRYPHTWGPGRQLGVIKGKHGFENVFALRHSAADGNYMWTVDGADGSSAVRFRDNLPGFKNFPSFGSLYRTKAFIADFDGDGKDEAAADSQGMYLWLNVYDGDGKPKYQLNLGPGDKGMGKFYLDLAAGDVTGDKRPEIAMVNKFRELVLLDGRAEALWSKPLPFMPAKVGVAGKKIYVTGGRRGMVFDGAGGPVAEFKLPENADEIVSAGDRVLIRCGKAVYGVK